MSSAITIGTFVTGLKTLRTALQLAIEVEKNMESRDKVFQNLVDRMRCACDILEHAHSRKPPVLESYLLPLITIVDEAQTIIDMCTCAMNAWKSRQLTFFGLKWYAGQFNAELSATAAQIESEIDQLSKVLDCVHNISKGACAYIQAPSPVPLPKASGSILPVAPSTAMGSGAAQLPPAATPLGPSGMHGMHVRAARMPARDTFRRGAAPLPGPSLAHPVRYAAQPGKCFIRCSPAIVRLCPRMSSEGDLASEEVNCKQIKTVDEYLTQSSKIGWPNRFPELRDQLVNKRLVLMNQDGCRLLGDQPLPDDHVELQLVDDERENMLRLKCFEECDKDMDGQLSYTELCILAEMMLNDDSQAETYVCALCELLKEKVDDIKLHAKLIPQGAIMELLRNLDEAALKEMLQCEGQQASSVKCDQGHELMREVLLPHSTRFCDGCGRAGNSVPHVWSCAKCDFDLCPKCLTTRVDN